MAGTSVLARLRQHLREGGHVWLFMDYDGTLVPIAHTPDEATPDPPLLELLTHIARVPAIHTAVVSGRPLATLQSMLPMPGLILAGTYGLEVQIADKVIRRGVAPQIIRPAVVQIKARWAEIVEGRTGFLIEDKGLAIALHARWADADDADHVLRRARAAAEHLLSTDGLRVLGGERFLEVAPEAAHKGRTVEWLLEQFPFPNALLVYFGDDDKDEEAFGEIRSRGGYPIGVGSRFPLPGAVERLPGPESVRDWLHVLWNDWLTRTI